MTGNCLQRDCRIFHCACKWADLIETRGEGHESEARDTPIRWLQADDATKSGWLADRSPGIGTEAHCGEPGGNRRGGPAAAPPGDPLGIPRIPDGLEGGILVR